MILEVDTRVGFAWSRVKPHYVSEQRLNEILDQMENDGKASRSCWTSIHVKYLKILNTWMFNDKENRKEIRVSHLIDVIEKEDSNKIAVVDFERYIWLKDKVIPNDEEDVVDESTGMDAYSAIQEKFNEHNKTTSLSLETVLSGKKYKKEFALIKKCVPTQIQFMNPYYKGKIVENVYKADVSSAFPTQVMKDLPTLHGCKCVKGRAEPTEEFPFAFYVNSHHIKTLDGYDSHEMNSVWYNEYYDCDDALPSEEDYTVLCKKMSDKYHDALAGAFKDCYDHRKEDSFNKFIMNAAIGYFHRNNYPALSFISAIVILRCNIDMIRRCEQLQEEGNTVLFIATDSIAWRGKLSPVAVDEKYLGSFTYEGKSIRFIGYSCKVYQWEGNDGTCTTKYSGVKRAVSAKFKFGEINYGEHKKKAERARYVWLEKEERFGASPLI